MSNAEDSVWSFTAKTQNWKLESPNKAKNEDLAKSKSINPTMLSDLQSTEGCSLWSFQAIGQRKRKEGW